MDPCSAWCILILALAVTPFSTTHKKRYVQPTHMPLCPVSILNLFACLLLLLTLILYTLALQMLSLADGLYAAASTDKNSLENQNLKRNQNIFGASGYTEQKWQRQQRKKQPINTKAGIQLGLHAVGSGLRSTYPPFFLG